MPENTNQPTPTQPASQGINWKNILIGVIIGAVLVGGGGFLVYNAYQPRKEELIQTTTTPTKTAMPSASKDKSGKCDTYSNKVVGVEFKCPEGWFFEETTIHEVKTVGLSDKPFDYEGKDNIMITINTGDNSNDAKFRFRDVEELKIGATETRKPDSDNPYTAKTTRLADVELGGVKGLQFEEIDIPVSKKEDITPYNLYIYFKRNDEYGDISLTVRGETTYKSAKEILKEILSTFKFLD
ncbi:MAG: hypothetical protein WD231_01895 [Candidatus Woykebacteria bacterium]